MNCPSGFTAGLTGQCRYICPSDFKYEQRPDGDACVYIKDNRHRIQVISLSGRDISREAKREQDRFERELQKVRKDIERSEADTQQLQTARNQSSQWLAQSGELTSQTASWREISNAGKDIQETTKSLRGMRAPTAPTTELDSERRAISIDLKRSLTFIQVVLFLVVLSLLAYLVLPTSYAHGITFLLLCVGVATGFFLRN